MAELELLYCGLWKQQSPVSCWLYSRVQGFEAHADLALYINVAHGLSTAHVLGEIGSCCLLLPTEADKAEDSILHGMFGMNC